MDLSVISTPSGERARRPYCATKGAAANDCFYGGKETWPYVQMFYRRREKGKNSGFRGSSAGFCTAVADGEISGRLTTC